MSVLRTVKKLLFGETLLLPVGLAVVVGGSVAARSLAREAWADYGAFAVLGGVVVVLMLSVAVTARPRVSRHTSKPLAGGTDQTSEDREARRPVDA
jgi:multisubunit Na+/H+ antiporter MnhB subunit